MSNDSDNHEERYRSELEIGPSDIKLNTPGSNAMSVMRLNFLPIYDINEKNRTGQKTQDRIDRTQ